MKEYFQLSSQRIVSSPCTITLGLFDGVHMGHKFLLHIAREQAAQKGGVLAAITFRSLPRVEGCLITSPYHKKVLLEQEGVDIVLELPFCEEVRRLHKKDFLHYIETMFSCPTWVVGSDVGFGENRSGDCTFLSQHAKGGVIPVEPLCRTKFSSTKIRERISEGDIAGASSLLGRSYSIKAKGTFFEENCFRIDGKDMCLPRRGVWQSLVRLGGDAQDIPARCVFSDDKICSVHLLHNTEKPRTFFLEIFPLSFISSYKEKI